MKSAPQSRGVAVQALDAFKSWFDSLERYGGNFPAKGTIGGALVVLERVKSKCDLDIESHTAKGGSQVKGASGTAVRRVLAAYRESRPFVAEGGRTNRGLRGDIKSMLDALSMAGLPRLPADDRLRVLAELQRFLVGKVGEFHAQKRLTCKYSPSQSVHQFVGAILKEAKGRGKEGPVAQYLVGAKLQLRFPDEKIENKSYSTADAPQEKSGDFTVGDTVFHVTVAPSLAVIEKCRRNFEENLRPWLLIPERSLAHFRPEMDALGGASVISGIESFVGQNVAEMAKFSADRMLEQLLRLVDIYNERVAQVDMDSSMLIDPPAVLTRGKR